MEKPGIEKHYCQKSIADNKTQQKSAHFSYQGEELELFRNALVWKRYFSSHIINYIAGQVLEVGAGTGETAKYLCSDKVTGWTCMEPDGTLIKKVNQKIRDSVLPEFFTARQETITSLSKDELFDTILYIDVLEHIENDRSELLKACLHLKSDGHLIILCPAHQQLFSRFDTAVGHFRRYSSRQLQSIIPDTVSLISLKYLDSVGLVASLANKLVMKNSYPTVKQIVIWDRFMVRLSKVFDILLFHRIGKSVIGIWKKQNENH